METTAARVISRRAVPHAGATLFKDTSETAPVRTIVDLMRATADMIIMSPLTCTVATGSVIEARGGSPLLLEKGAHVADFVRAVPAETPATGALTGREKEVLGRALPAFGSGGSHHARGRI